MKTEKFATVQHSAFAQSRNGHGAVQTGQDSSALVKIAYVAVLSPARQYGLRVVIAHLLSAAECRTPHKAATRQENTHWYQQCR